MSIANRHPNAANLIIIVLVAFVAGITVTLGIGFALGNGKDGGRWSGWDRAVGWAYFNGSEVLRRNGRYETALNWLHYAAEIGDAEAQTRLGMMYSLGDAVVQDEAKGRALIRAAAEQGHVPAQHKFALVLRDGRGGPRDMDASVRWYRQAADQGFAQAQFGLGRLYETGEGVPQDRHLAEVWYRKAMDQGHAMAHNNLAWMWAEQGIKLDQAEALVQIALAKEPGNPTMADTLGWILFKRGDLKGAAVVLRRTVAEAPTYGEAWAHLGIVRLSAGKRTEAQSAFRKALALDLTEPRRREVEKLLVRSGGGT